MMKQLFILPFLFLCLLADGQGIADTSLYRIETIDGNEYYGKIVVQDAKKITLKTELLGEITIPKNSIKSMERVSTNQLKGGKYWFENPQSTRYFWQPNGFGLKKGEGYYQNVWIFFNQVSVGITEHFSLGAGTVPLFLFAGESTPLWLTPKFSIPVKKESFNLGIGALVGTVVGESEAGFGIVYGSATLGNRDKNMNIGLGYGYAGGEWANTPLFTLSGMLRTGQRGYIMTENYYINTSDESLILLSIGGRRLIKKAGIDFGLFLPTRTGGNWIAIPWLGFSIPFGQSRQL